MLEDDIPLAGPVRHPARDKGGIHLRHARSDTSCRTGCHSEELYHEPGLVRRMSAAGRSLSSKVTRVPQSNKNLSCVCLSVFVSVTFLLPR